MKPYAQRCQSAYTCERCEAFFVIEGWIERDDVYLGLDECPECRAPIDLDIACGAVTPLFLV